MYAAPTDGPRLQLRLVSTQFHVARLNEGGRGVHPLELLSARAIFAPAGRIDPRQTRTLRVIREHLPELRKAMNARA